MMVSPGQFHTPFAFGDKVTVDGDASITATVIGFAFYPHQSLVFCAWFNNGAVVEAWFGDFRLTRRDSST